MNNAKATADGALGQIGMKYISRTSFWIIHADLLCRLRAFMTNIISELQIFVCKMLEWLSNTNDIHTSVSILFYWTVTYE